MPPKRRGTNPPVPFVYKLVLNQWILALFGVEKFEKLAEIVRNEALEGMDENNVHHFHHALVSQLFNQTNLTSEILLEYDQNIVSHTLKLNERRITRGEDPIKWKYFQYLSLLFTEVYLDRYFSDPDSLLTSINEQAAKYNEGKKESDQVQPLDDSNESWQQLNKLAFWMATGSGKTLLMHANILQFQHYVSKHGKSKELNRVILLTPNEGLSEQHRKEFEAAGIQAERFNKDARSLFSGRSVEIIEVTKLKDEMGEKTVAVDAFEGNNLVLVDEGHRGASGGGDGVWMKYRNKLCENGFSFEYSATFGQAVKSDKSLADQYAKSILVDYSYRYFYGDGFGKDYQILNLDEATQIDHQDVYMTACLLSFYQQVKLFQDKESEFRPFKLEKPLWIFVGGSVTASLGTKDASDIVEILKFLSRYVSNRAASIERINRVLNQGLANNRGRNLFEGRFTYLNLSGHSPEAIFDDTLSVVFNAPGGGNLYVENLKGATGEVALRLGDGNEDFGVINVGDDAKLVKLCDENGLETGDREFKGSLFHEINEDHSRVNILIGSKKFSEGWSSWRVSTMGLMNVGKSEGAQIIQLFGRGVRLKGINFSLKRSSQARLPDDLERPKHIGLLETLGIFGIHASYMAQFRDFLKEEGLPSNEEMEEMLLPVIKNSGSQPLKTIRLKKTINGVSTDFGDAFRKLGPIPSVAPPDNDYLTKNKVVLNWYPKIQALRAKGLTAGEGEMALNSTHLSPNHLAFIDTDKVLFELERFKAERGWYNLNITRKGVADLLTDQSWYNLLIPADELAFTSFGRVRLWEEIALSLLREYTKRYYTFRKREWELPHLEYRELESTDPNLLGVGKEEGDAYYRILIDKSQEEIVSKLGELKTLIESKALQDWSFQAIHAVCFDRHLFQPLMHLDSKVIEISPAPMNTGEKNFVEDLRTFYQTNPQFFEGKELYLLRNLSRGKGVGFFEAGNFHPDFILWLLDGETQHIVFIDPKGIRNLGFDDPKIRFFETIKEIESRLDDPNVHLHSYIVSSTPSTTMKMLWNVDKEQILARNILFQVEERDEYVSTLIKQVIQ